MIDKVHMLEVYDLEENAGPNPIRLVGQFVVRGPEGSQYYILKPQDPMQLDGRSIECLAIRPHYDGDSITNAVESVCTVGIAFPSNCAGYQEGVTYGFNDFIFWKVGKINPHH